MSKSKTVEKFINRNHFLLLYTDNPSHCEALEKIKKSYDYAAILHDRDLWTAEDEKKDSKHKEGTLKKAHWHVLLRFKNAKWSTALCKELGIDTRFDEEVKNFDNALQYLIHYNDSDKTQYSPDEVFGTIKTKLKDILNRNEKTEGEKVVELIQFIKEYNGKLSITDFASYCALNGYWSEFRRSGAIFCKIIEEKNQPYYKQENNVS